MQNMKPQIILHHSHVCGEGNILDEIETCEKLKIKWMEIDVREKNGEFFVSHQREWNGGKVKLADALEACKEYGIGAYLDVKYVKSVENFLKLVSKFNVIVGSYDWFLLEQANSVVQTSLMIHEITNAQELIELKERHETDFIHPCWDWHNERLRFLEELLKYTKDIVTWAEDDFDVAREIFKKKIKFMMIDTPDFVLSLQSSY